jgi:hypothetical protein
MDNAGFDNCEFRLETLPESSQDSLYNDCAKMRKIL